MIAAPSSSPRQISSALEQGICASANIGPATGAISDQAAMRC
ncbi:hypothetical protein [Qipengyuania spongiae]|nr:hypothetical protein [Qipengyuania spongiae]